MKNNRPSSAPPSKVKRAHFADHKDVVSPTTKREQRERVEPMGARDPAMSGHFAGAANDGVFANQIRGQGQPSPQTHA